MPPLLQRDDIFLSKKNLGRISLQTEYEKIYNSEHVWNKIVTNDGTVANIDPLIPIAATISEISSDLIFGEFPRIDMGQAVGAWEKIGREYFNIGRSFEVDLLEASVQTSAIGMVWWTIWRKDEKTWWSFVKPQKTAWESDFFGLTMWRLFEEIDRDVKKKSITYSIKEYDKRKDGVWYIEYDVVIDVNTQEVKGIGDLIVEEKLEFDFIPVIPVYNIKVLNCDVGRSDYQGKQQLLAEIDNRVDQINFVLQEHGDPWLLIPSGILDKYGRFHRSQGKLIEKSAAAAGIDNTVDITTWDASLSSAFQQIDNLIRLVYATSRISSALSPFADMSGGNAESGRSLKWRSVTTISMINRKRLYWEMAIRMFYHYMSKIEPTMKNLDAVNMKIEWPDGLPVDDDTFIDTIAMRVREGLLDRVEAIRRIEDTDAAEAQKMADKIGAEKTEEADISARRLGGATF